MPKKNIMQTVKAISNVSKPRATNYSFIAFILIVLVSLGLYLFNSYQVLHPSALPNNVITLSQQALEEQYGLHVNLIALTAADGMVDLRLKIVDGKKAKKLLQDKKNFPAVFVNSDVTLNASEDMKSQEIKFENGFNLFVIYPNAGNMVKRGVGVTILFGDVALEPIKVK